MCKNDTKRVLAMVELVVQATLDNFTKVRDFIDEQLEMHGCRMKQQLQIAVAVEELFVNIANYAYTKGLGDASIGIDFEESPKAVTIVFKDHGIPYNPLAKSDPDISLPADKRQIGGLGIFMVKKSMDDLSYEYKDGQNIMTIRKYL